MMMMFRTILTSAALLATCTLTAAAQSAGDARLALAAPVVDDSLAPLGSDVIAVPVLRETVKVTGDVVRIGDIVDNAGSQAQVAIYRAPDLGTTGTLTAAQVVATLRNHQMYGVDTHGVSEVRITRLARTLRSQDIEQKIARALVRRYGLGANANLAITFDRDLGVMQLDASNTGELRAISTRYDARNNRFDVLMEVANSESGVPTPLRFTGTAVETVDAAVLVRAVEANEVLKASDVITEPRPRSEVGNDPASRDRAVGMQVRRALRAGQPLRAADLGNPDLVQRDQSVTLVYENDGLYLTVRAKALESGTAGDQVSVLNPQSKRTVQGVVTGPGQVTVLVATSRPITTAAANVSADDKPQQP
jgi:flagellar basal body P-ring formation protein FlgA